MYVRSLRFIETAAKRATKKYLIKCNNKTASCNDETCPLTKMFGRKEDPPSQE